MKKKMKNIFQTTIFFCFFSFILSQNIDTSLTVKSNPINGNYWFLEQNNSGKSILKNDLELEIIYKRAKTQFHFNISNSFKDIHYLLSDNFKVLDIKPGKTIYFGEAYLKHNLSDNFYLKVGKYYRDFSNYLDDSLSSGSMLISKNAQAMPKIGIVGSNNINNKIGFNYGIAHGTFGRNEFYNESPLLHEKFLYLNIKKNTSQFSIGFVHEAVWAGSTIERGKQPSSLDDFLRVFISADRKLEDYDDNIPDTHLNALGNHLGIWDFSYQKKYDKKLMKFYYQHIFDDTSGLRFANHTDGLWGTELQNYIPNNTTVLEFINTSNYDINPPYVFDRYYYHHTYRLGWSYKNLSLGNPFINHLNFSPTKVLYFASKGGYRSYKYEIKLYKKIDIRDTVSFRISLNKILSSKLNFGTFIINNSKNKATGFSLSYIF